MNKMKTLFLTKAVLCCRDKTIKANCTLYRVKSKIFYLFIFLEKKLYFFEIKQKYKNKES